MEIVNHLTPELFDKFLCNTEAEETLIAIIANNRDQVKAILEEK